MLLKVAFFIYLIMVIMILISIRSLTHVYGILTETGICTDGKIIIGDETQILNQSAAKYIKNLTMDNRLLAEMVCHSMLNETTAR